MKKLKDKELCKLVKDDVLKDHPEAFRALLEHATHYCLKCGRACNEKRRLCHPEKLKDD